MKSGALGGDEQPERLARAHGDAVREALDLALAGGLRDLPVLRAGLRVLRPDVRAGIAASASPRPRPRATVAGRARAPGMRASPGSPGSRSLVARTAAAAGEQDGGRQRGGQRARPHRTTAGRPCVRDERRAGRRCRRRGRPTRRWRTRPRQAVEDGARRRATRPGRRRCASRRARRRRPVARSRTCSRHSRPVGVGPALVGDPGPVRRQGRALDPRVQPGQRALGQVAADQPRVAAAADGGVEAVVVGEGDAPDVEVRRSVGAVVQDHPEVLEVAVVVAVAQVAHGGRGGEAGVGVGVAGDEDGGRRQGAVRGDPGPTRDAEQGQPRGLVQRGVQHGRAEPVEDAAVRAEADAAAGCHVRALAGPLGQRPRPGRIAERDEREPVERRPQRRVHERDVRRRADRHHVGAPRPRRGAGGRRAIGVRGRRHHGGGPDRDGQHTDPGEHPEAHPARGGPRGHRVVPTVGRGPSRSSRAADRQDEHQGEGGAAERALR